MIDAAALAAWLQGNVPNFAGPMTLSEFAGGHSNPTYRVDTPGRAYVLRRKPFGALLESAHAVDREYRIIAALHPLGFPVPRPHGLCVDPAVIGSAFYVMEMVEGRNLKDGSLPGLAPAERAATYHSMIDTLAVLHSIDIHKAGLGDFGKPGNYFERQLTRWSRQYRGSQTDELAEMEWLMQWLPRTHPVQERVSIVHGDYRLDNLIFGAATANVAAVLDWELSTLGDPIADLSYVLMNWIPGREARSSVAGLDLAALGIPTLDALAERYARKAALPRVPDLHWYFAFNLFRLACIVQGIKKRALDGTATHAQAAETGARVQQYARAACACAARAGGTP